MRKHAKTYISQRASQDLLAQYTDANEKPAEACMLERVSFQAIRYNGQSCRRS